MLTLTSGTQVHFWDTDTLEMIKTLDCPIVNPTLGGRSNIQVLVTYECGTRTPKRGSGIQCCGNAMLPAPRARSDGARLHKSRVRG